MSNEILPKTENEFYKNAVNYWSEIPATVDGMLGGFGHISQIDIRTSKVLLKQLFNSREPTGRSYALDCGAGIGRITKYLLTDLFDKVDMVEQNAKFLSQAKSYLGANTIAEKIGIMYPIGLQDFSPEPNKYDVIWIQWVLGHLTDQHFMEFMIRCGKGLKENGRIVVKENIASCDEIDIDEQDSSMTRPMIQFTTLFEKANLNCVKLMKQQHFPKGLYTVYMFVLKPNNDKTEDNNLENKNAT